MNIGHYGKAITYIALTAVTFLVSALTDNALSTGEILNLVVVVLGAVGVYLVPNLPSGIGKYAKTGIAFLTAGVVAALSFYTDGISTSEWLQIIVAAFTAIGVFIVPNEPKVVGAGGTVVINNAPPAVDVPVTTGPVPVSDIPGVSPVDAGDARG